MSSSACPSEHIDFTIGLDFLTPRERARFQRRAARAYRKAGRLAHSRAEAEGCANPMPERPVRKVPRSSGAPPSVVLPVTPRSANDIPQVCAFRLVSLAEAQATASIRYHGLN